MSDGQELGEAQGCWGWGGLSLLCSWGSTVQAPWWQQALSYGHCWPPGLQLLDRPWEGGLS